MSETLLSWKEGSGSPFPISLGLKLETDFYGLEAKKVRALEWSQCGLIFVEREEK